MAIKRFKNTSATPIAIAVDHFNTIPVRVGGVIKLEEAIGAQYEQLEVVVPKKAAPVVEEPVVETPAAEEPVAEEPVAEEPVVEEPVVEAPKPKRRGRRKKTEA